MNLAPMRVADVEHDEPIILNVNEDALVAHPVTPVLLINEWLAQQPRVVDAAQGALKKYPNTLRDLRIELMNLLLRAGGDVYGVGHFLGH
jgi:hypothetical protein